MTLTKGTCSRPDPGWNCTGDEGHDGPCAAWPDDPRLDPTYEDLAYDELAHVYEFGVFVAAVLVFGLVGVGVLVGLAIK